MLNILIATTKYCYRSEHALALPHREPGALPEDPAAAALGQGHVHFLYIYIYTHMMCICMFVCIYTYIYIYIYTNKHRGVSGSRVS